MSKPGLVWSVIALIVIVGGVAFYHVYGYARQQMRIRTIESVGGRVDDRGELTPTAVHFGPLPGRPVLDDDSFRRAFPSLKRSPHLTSLYLNDTNVTDSSLVLLQDLPSLQTLDLSGTGVTDEGLRAIGRLSNLEYLKLDKTQVSSSGLSHIPTNELEYLSLVNTPIDDALFAHLSHTPKLRRLHLADTNVSGQIVDNVVILPSLSFIDIRRTRLTSDDVQRLRQERPGIFINENKGVWINEESDDRRNPSSP